MTDHTDTTREPTISRSAICRDCEDHGDGSYTCDPQRPACPYGDVAPTLPADEATDELREALARWLRSRYPVTPDEAQQDADALLAGPLAPLLVKLRAVEALVAFYDRHEYSTLNVDDLRRAIAEEAS